MTDKEFGWIDVTTSSEFMEGQLLKSLQVCYQTYAWAFDQALNYWLRHGNRPTKGLAVANFYYKRYELDPDHVVQKRSLIFAIQQALNDLHEKLDEALAAQQETDQKVIISLPTLNDYYEITISHRSKWKKYLEEYGSISTVYGTLTLEGNWQKVFAAQAAKMKTSLEVLPWLWNSLTIRYKNEKWQVKFNYYDPLTKMGRRKRNEQENTLARSTT